MGEAKEVAQTQPEITTLRVYVDDAEYFRMRQREYSARFNRDLNQSEVIRMLLRTADRHGIESPVEA